MARDVSLAYLHLGIAYFGEGHESAAKANSRDAVIQFREISLEAPWRAPQDGRGTYTTTDGRTEAGTWRLTRE